MLGPSRSALSSRPFWAVSWVTVVFAAALALVAAVDDAPTAYAIVAVGLGLGTLCVVEFLKGRNP